MKLLFMRNRSLLIFVSLIFCAVVCTRPVLAAVSDMDSFSIKEISNISYYDDEALDSDLTQLNLIIPEGVERPPVFMWIGGGAWAYVDRNKEMALCREMVKQGVLMVSVGHRLSPALLFEPKREGGIQHPEHIKDIAQAVRWVFDHADEYGYSQNNIFIGGYSSRAHLAALLVADNSYLNTVGLSTEDINAIVPVAGAYDIPHYRNSLEKEDVSMIANHIIPVFGKTKEGYLNASPISFMEKFNTPMLLVSEGQTYEYSVVFEQALQEKGQDNFQVLNCHNETHNSLWFKLSKPEPNIYRNYIVDFIHSQCK